MNDACEATPDLAQPRTMTEALAHYDAEIKRLVANPQTVQENTWRGLLASFAFEIAAASDYHEQSRARAA